MQYLKILLIIILFIEILHKWKYWDSFLLFCSKIKNFHAKYFDKTLSNLYSKSNIVFNIVKKKKNVKKVF